MNLVKRADFFQSESVFLYMPEKYSALEICGIEYDSRKVSKGSLFAAIEGFKVDGCSYIDSAIKAGAAAVLIPSSRLSEFEFLAENIAIFFTDDTRKALSEISSKFFDKPSEKMNIIAVTGTNGKTSITYMLESILNNVGKNCGVIGTVNYRWKENILEAPNTTPESRDLHELLYKMLCDGVDTVAMEVSSHALALGRVDGICFNIAVFTNLTEEHLDFHHDMEAYFDAKSKLFDLLENSSKQTRIGIVNADDEYCLRILDRKYSYPVFSFGTKNNANYMVRAGSIQNKITGLSYIMLSPQEGVEISLPIVGSFHVSNSLASFAVTHCLGIGVADIAKGLAALKSVPGRFNVVNSKLGFGIVIDYAHTPDALLNLLVSVSEIPHSRIITVFGCGGDKDKTKRPKMGRIAFDHSDLIIITSDNPRTEDPVSIIKDILSGITCDDGTPIEGDKVDVNRLVIPDRREAIGKAIGLAQADDIVVIAGKGHEDYQILGKTKIKFDDHDVVREFIEIREKT